MKCVEASPRERKRPQTGVAKAAEFHLESAGELSLPDVLDVELELEQVSGAAKTVTQSRSVKLLVCQFFDGLVYRFRRSVGSLTVTFVRVKQLQERTL